VLYRLGFLQEIWKHKKFNIFLLIPVFKDLCLFLLHLVLSDGVVEFPGLLSCYTVSIGGVTGKVVLYCLTLKKEAFRSVEEPVTLHQHVATFQNIWIWFCIPEHKGGYIVLVQDYLHNTFRLSVIAPKCSLTVDHLQGAFFSMFSFCFCLACSAFVSVYHVQLMFKLTRNISCTW
jgi:hypothetical protein